MNEDKKRYLIEAIIHIKAGYDAADEHITYTEILSKMWAGCLITDFNDLSELSEHFRQQEESFQKFVDNGGYSDEEYKETVLGIADYLCSFSCGTSADGIIEYFDRPDISMSQCVRIEKELYKLIRGVSDCDDADEFKNIV